MSVNLLEAIQIQMGYPALQKIDPNTQVVVEDSSTPNEDRFSQAAIPAVLTALYKYSRTDEGAENILLGNPSTVWTDVIFADNKESILQKIAAYSFYSQENAMMKMHSIAASAVSMIKEKLPENAASHDVKLFLTGQRNNILLYLPAVLQMGEMLHDNTLDDRTNKMEGPVSSMMRAIGSQFSDGEVEKKETNIN